MKFTKENAQHFAKLSHAPTSARWLPKALPTQQSQQTAQIAPFTDDFTLRRLMRVRRQLNMVDRRIEEEACKQGGIDADGKMQLPCDGQLLNWLCSAQERLAEQERVLSNRPLPGTLKPTAAPKHSREKPAPVTLPPVDPTP